MLDSELDYADNDPFWDLFYDIENLLDYYQDDRIDHAFVTYRQWCQMVVF